MTSDLKTRIMRRVYLVWFFRQLFSPFLIKFYVLALAFWQIGRLVWVEKVFSNALAKPDWSASIGYLAQSVSSTELTVQLLLGVTLVGGLWIFRDLIFAGRSQVPTFNLRRF